MCTPLFRCLLCAFAVVFTLAVVPLHANAQSSYTSLMSQGKKQFAKQQFDAALASFQKALRKLRGKPLYQKVPAYLHIGLCLFEKGNKGLAWKAFEQGLYQDSSAALPAFAGAPVKTFFERVRRRVLQRGGDALARSQTTTPKASTGSGGGPTYYVNPSPWPWVALGVGLASAALGVGLILNASSNQAEVDAWVAQAVAGGTNGEVVDRSAKPLIESISTRNTAGIVALAVGGTAVVGGIVLFFVLPKPKPPATALKLPPPTKTTALGSF